MMRVTSFFALALPFAASTSEDITSNATSGEIAIPVVLWDQNGKPATSGRPPRFVIGSASIGGRSQRFTFDAGNAKQPILLAEGCLGCSSGCPSTVPKCSSGASACWPSHAGDYAPAHSYVVTGDSCPSGVKSAGTLNGAPVCTQCFGGKSHSRFYTMAKADVTLAGASGDVKVKNLRFGALVRTAPAIDRVWSNLGVGFQSAFMQQLGASSVLFHLRHDGNSEVVFNPDSNRYGGAPSAAFRVEGNRVHSVRSIRVGGTTIDTSGQTFHIDTGNAGISIAQSSVLSKLKAAAKGLTPKTAPELVLNLDGIAVTLPGSTWMTGNGRTVFSSYHKNVLGLPFLSAGDIVFDDKKKRIYIAGAGSTPSPTPGPTPPAPSGCMAACKGYADVCDCECFCSCDGVCGGGCYGRCKSMHQSCSGNCPESRNQTTLV